MAEAGLNILVYIQVSLQTPGSFLKDGKGWQKLAEAETWLRLFILIYSSDTSGVHPGMEHSKKLQVLQQKYLQCDGGYGSFPEAAEAES